VKVGKKVQFKFLYRKNPKNNYGKNINNNNNKLWQKFHLFLFRW
jgi:hypothetical protein